MSGHLTCYKCSCFIHKNSLILVVCTMFVRTERGMFFAFIYFLGTHTAHTAHQRIQRLHFKCGMEITVNQKRDKLISVCQHPASLVYTCFAFIRSDVFPFLICVCARCRCVSRLHLPFTSVTVNVKTGPRSGRVEIHR